MRRPSYSLIRTAPRSRIIEKHEFALKTLKNLGGAHPTVVWSGNGYHIYQPINTINLEQNDIFSEFEQPILALFTMVPSQK